MYKFYAKPNQAVMSKRTNKMMFRFDTKGEFITDDPEIINRAKGYFDCIELKAEEVGEKIEGSSEERVLTITTKEEKKEKKEYKYKELQEMAKARGIKSFGIKQDELEKLLEV